MHDFSITQPVLFSTWAMTDLTLVLLFPSKPMEAILSACSMDYPRTGLRGAHLMLHLLHNEALICSNRISSLTSSTRFFFHHLAFQSDVLPTLGAVTRQSILFPSTVFSSGWSAHLVPRSCFEQLSLPRFIHIITLFTLPARFGPICGGRESKLMLKFNF